jgi:hypothetical protein
MLLKKLVKSPPVILLLVALMAYWPIASCVYTFKWDMLDVVFPFRYFTGECIKNGVFPLWNPYLLTGSPVAADLQYPVWSPEVWLIGITTGYSIYTLHFLFMAYIFLAGYGMYRLVQYLSGSRPAGSITGIAYMLSGFFVGHGQALFAIIGAAFLPLVVMYALKSFTKPSLSHALKLALFLYFQISTGYQFISIMTAYLVLVLFMYFLFKSIKNRNQLSDLIRYNSLMLSLVALLCLVILVPAIQFSGLSQRMSMGLTYEKAKIYPFTPECLISLLTPFATVKYPEFFQTDISMRNMHVGLIMLVAFAASLFRRKTRLQWIILTFGIICFLAALGELVPIHRILFRFLPFLNRIRMPAYFNLFTIFTILVCTGQGLPDLLNKTGKYRKTLIVVLSLTAVLLVTLLVFSSFHIDFAGSPLHGLIHHPAFTLDTMNIHEHILLQAPLQLLFVTFILILLLIQRLNRYLRIGLPLIVTAEMVIAVNLNIYFTVLSTVKPYEIQRFMEEQPKGFPPPDLNIPVAYNSDKELTRDPLWRNMGILTKRISNDGFSSFVLDAYNFLDDSLPVLREALLGNPPVYLSGNVKRITALDKKATEYHSNTLFVSDSVFSFLPSGMKQDFHAGYLHITQFSPLKLAVKYETDSSSVLTYLQSHIRGWEVRLDGKEHAHFTSNFLYLSTLAPAGSHTIVFEYRNPLAVFFFCITSITLAVIAMVLIYAGVQKHRLIRKQFSSGL